jgi:hypothetical protein
LATTLTNIDAVVYVKQANTYNVLLKSRLKISLWGDNMAALIFALVVCLADSDSNIGKLKNTFLTCFLNGNFVVHLTIDNQRTLHVFSVS